MRTFFLLLMVVTCFVSLGVNAQSPTLDLPLAHEGILDNVVEDFTTATQGWEPYVQSTARSLLFSLAAISLAWLGIRSAMERKEFSDITQELVLFTVTIGFYLLCIENIGWVVEAVLDLFLRTAGDLIADDSSLKVGGQLVLSPSTVINRGFSIWNTLSTPPTGLMTLLSGEAMFYAVLCSAAGLVIAILFTGMAAFLVLVLVEGWTVISAGILFLGFAGTDFTIDIAKNYLRYILSFAAKLFAVFIIMAVGLTVLDELVMKNLRLLEVTQLPEHAYFALLRFVVFYSIAIPATMLILSFMVPAVLVQIVGGMGSHSNFALNSVLTTTLMSAAAAGKSVMDKANVGAHAGAGGVKAGMGAAHALGKANPDASVGDKLKAFTKTALGQTGAALKAGASSAMAPKKGTALYGVQKHFNPASGGGSLGGNE